jgi:Na+-driven multidrug efflux pump
MILGFNWGIVGAGVSTLVANVLMTPVMLYVFMKPRNGVKIIFKKKMFDKDLLIHLVKVSIPASVGQALQALGFAILNSVIYTYGRTLIEGNGGIVDEEANALSAAYYIGSRINSLVLFPVMAVTSVLAIYISQNIGAGNIPRAKKSFRTGFIISFIMMTVGMFIIIPFRDTLVRLFNNDPETLVFASEYMLYLHLGLPLMGIYQTYLSTFQGSGDTKFTLILASVRLWLLRLPLVFLLLYGFQLGPVGAWWAMLISNLLMLPLGMFLYNKIDFKPKIKESIIDTEAVVTD